jgi:hypothetical protein
MRVKHKVAVLQNQEPGNKLSLADWFDDQLRSTLDGFIWAVHQLLQERWYEHPPMLLGEWSAAEHVYHMLNYEKRLAHHVPMAR